MSICRKREAAKLSRHSNTKPAPRYGKDLRAPTLSTKKPAQVLIVTIKSVPTQNRGATISESLTPGKDKKNL